MDDFKDALKEIIEPIGDKLAEIIPYGEVIIELKGGDITFIKPRPDIKVK